jgi:6-pyruvoyltetrahydropterin/6-carboxytetrahydropterin synthase
MIFITRREVFSASHRVYNEKLSDAENEKIFGKCSNPNGHGHNYILEVIVKGEVNPETGYVIDLKILKKIIIENVVGRLDHKNLNLDVDFLHGKIPSAENIAIGIWNQLADKLPAGELHSIKLYETENNYVEFRGNKKI